MSNSVQDLDAQLYGISQQLADLEARRNTLIKEQNRVRRLRSEALNAERQAQGAFRCAECPQAFASEGARNAHFNASHQATSGRGKVAFPGNAGPSRSVSPAPTGGKAGDIPLLKRCLIDREVTHRTFGKGRVTLIEHRGSQLQVHVLFVLMRRSRDFYLSALLDPMCFELSDDDTYSVVSRLLALVEGHSNRLAQSELLRFKGRTIRLAGLATGHVVVVNERFITLKVDGKDEYRSYWTADFSRDLTLRHELAMMRRLLKGPSRDLSNLTLHLAPIKPAAKRNTVRSTHCWKCQTGLSNLQDVECDECRGIICACGACLCGYGGWKR